MLKIECKVQNLKKSKVKPTPITTNSSYPTLKEFLLFAYFIEQQVEEGVCSYTELAKSMDKTPTRISQIVRFRYVAPVIQEEILRKNPPVAERRFRPIFKELLWSKQVELWEELKQSLKVSE